MSSTSIAIINDGIRFKNASGKPPREIDFQPGYWEWVVYTNGTAFYSFGDISDDIPDGCNVEELRSVVEELVECMNIGFLCNDEDLLTDDEQKILIEKMVERLAYQYLDGVETFSK